MKLFALTLLLIGILAGIHGEVFAAVENGIYRDARAESAPRIKLQDGKEVRLGAKRALKIQKSEIFAQDNANTQFYLQLTIPYDKEALSYSHVLVVDGTAYQQNGGGSSQDVASYLDFIIEGLEKAKEVAKYLGTSVVTRKHPQHQLCVSFLPSKSAFKSAEEVTVTLQIKNVGINTIAFMKGGRNRALRDNQYVFTARFGGKQVVDIGSSDHAGGLAFRKVLKPGETFEEKISLNKWFSFDKEGSYALHGAYYISLVEVEADSWREVWEDYASADFAVMRGAK